MKEQIDIHIHNSIYIIKGRLIDGLPFFEVGSKTHFPTCGSKNIEKISLTKKAIGGAMFGLFSSNVRKTMYCKNCGYKW